MFEEATRTAKTKRKVIGKIGIVMFEESAAFLDSFHLPLLAKRQARTVRSLYRKANELAKLVGLPAKKYKRLKSREVMEVIV